MRARNLCMAVFVLLFAARTGAAQEITVAAAADLQFAFHDVVARFEKDTGKHVKLIYGSSGNFFAQIQSPLPSHRISFSRFLCALQNKNT